MGRGEGPGPGGWTGYGQDEVDAHLVFDAHLEYSTHI